MDGHSNAQYKTDRSDFISPRGSMSHRTSLQHTFVPSFACFVELTVHSRNWSFVPLLFERDFYKLVKNKQACADSSSGRAPFRSTFLRFIRCLLNDRFSQLVRTGTVKNRHIMEKVTVKTPLR